MRIKLLESTLTEDIASTREKYAEIPDETFNELIGMDPTFDKSKDKVGTYGKWILDKFKAGTVTESDFGHIKDCLSRFDDNKKNLKVKDIYKFKTLSDIDAYLNDNGSYVELTDRQLDRERRKEKQAGWDALKDVSLEDESEYMGRHGNYDVYVPLTYQASCKLGEGASWCTADPTSDDYYNRYLRSYGGKYYIFININNPKDKYQLHAESGQFNSIGNVDIEPSDNICSDTEAMKFAYDVVSSVVKAKYGNEIKIDYYNIPEFFASPYYSRNNTNVGGIIQNIIDNDIFELFDNFDWIDNGYAVENAPEPDSSTKEILDSHGINLFNDDDCTSWGDFVDKLSDMGDEARISADDFMYALRKAYSAARDYADFDELCEDVDREFKKYDVEFDYDNRGLIYKPTNEFDTEPTYDNIMNMLHSMDEDGVEAPEDLKRRLDTLFYNWNFYGDVEMDIFNEELDGELFEVMG